MNHSVTFVDPVTCVHMQNAESYWNRDKTKLKRMKGCHAHQIPSYLDEFMWRERYGQSKRVAFNSMRDIAHQYRVREVAVLPTNPQPAFIKAINGFFQSHEPLFQSHLPHKRQPKRLDFIRNSEERHNVHGYRVLLSVIKG